MWPEAVRASGRRRTFFQSTNYLQLYIVTISPTPTGSAPLFTTPLSTHIEDYRKTMTVSRYKYKSWQTKTVILSVTYVLYNSYTPYSCYLTLVGKCGRQWFPKSKQIKKKNYKNSKSKKIKSNQNKFKELRKNLIN